MATVTICSDFGAQEKKSVTVSIVSASICREVMAEISRKISSSTLLTMPKPLTVWITKNCGKFFKKQEYQTILLAS